MKKILLLLILAASFSCSRADDDYSEQNIMDIEAYISLNNLSYEKTASGLYYVIHTEGTGNSPSMNSNVTLKYKGYFLNNEIFDESDSATFYLSEVIQGFSEGVQLIKEGGSASLIIPSDLAYGNTSSGPISPGDVLLFDIDLISIN